MFVYWSWYPHKMSRSAADEHYCESYFLCISSAINKHIFASGTFTVLPKPIRPFQNFIQSKFWPNLNTLCIWTVAEFAEYARIHWWRHERLSSAWCGPTLLRLIYLSTSCICHCVP